LKTRIPEYFSAVIIAIRKRTMREYEVINVTFFSMKKWKRKGLLAGKHHTKSSLSQQGKEVVILDRRVMVIFCLSSKQECASFCPYMSRFWGVIAMLRCCLYYDYAFFYYDNTLGKANKL